MPGLFDLATERAGGIVAVGVAVAAAIVLHWLVLRIASRAAAHSATVKDDSIIHQLRGPSRLLLIALALSAAQPALDLGPDGLRAWNRISGMVFPALVGWLVIAMLNFAADVIRSRNEIGVADNLHARRRRTRVDILHRITVILVFVATFCFMLMSIPSVRSIGVTLIASAGLAALAVGAAAQPALKNLISGFQMAFTEPIRIDDVVVIDGEWGRIEEIRLTYVVVKIWDERRLIVPVSKFLEESFQNWTRQTSAILGTVIWHLDPATDVDRLREKLREIVEANPRWDQRFCNLQVTDTRPDAIEVRALMTAKDASAAFDLRCDVREALLRFVRTEMPQALVRRRGLVALDKPVRGEA